MIRKVRSSKSGSSGSKPSKGGQQPEWEEDAGAGGGDISPRSDGADTGNGNSNERCSTTRENEKSMAGLQSKNYKLAKELSEVRVRHREESKNVTRLTMENMNLASRCREAITQAAALKKELMLQKKKTAEAVAQTVAVIEQLKKMQRQQKQKQSVAAVATEAPPTLSSSSTNKASKPAAVVSPSAPEEDLSPTDSMTHSESSDADEIVVVETPAVVVDTAAEYDSDSSDTVGDAPATVASPTAHKSETTDAAPECSAQSCSTTPVSETDTPTESKYITDVKQLTPQHSGLASTNDPPPLVTPPTGESVVSTRETKGLTVDDIIEEMDAEEALELNLLISDVDIAIDTTTADVLDECDDSDDIMEVSGEEVNLTGTGTVEVEETNEDGREDQWLSVVNAAVAEARSSWSNPLPPPGSHAAESGLVSSDDFDETGVSMSGSNEDSYPVENDNDDDGDSQRAVKGSKGDCRSTNTSQESNPAPLLSIKEKDHSNSTSSPLRKALSSLLHKKDRTTKEAKATKKERKGSKTDSANQVVVPVPTVEKRDVPAIEKREVDRVASKSLSTFDPVVELGKRPLTLTEDIENMVRESKTDDLWREDFDEAAETQDIITSLHSEGPVKKNYFADSASPKIMRSHLSSKFPRTGSSFNEEMPSDMIQQPHRSGRVSTLGSLQKDENDGVSSTLLSSIDAFEASFNTSFPESFSTKERESALAKKVLTSAKAASDISIYNPFDTDSPSKDKPSLEISDDSDDAPLSPGGNWGMKRAKDRVAYLRANSRNAKRQFEEDSSPQSEPTPHTGEPLSLTESIISISRTPDREMKNEIAPSLRASSYRMIHKALSTEKQECKSSLAAAPLEPDLRYQKFAAVATPTKTSSTSTSLDRFSSPVEPAVPVRPEKSLGYSEARSRYETALGHRSTQKTVTDRTSNTARSSAGRSVRSTTPTLVGESASLNSKDSALQPTAIGPRVRERATRFSASPGVDFKGVSPRNSWDDGDIPMRSTLSPTSEEKTELSVGTRNPYTQSLNNSAVSVPGVNGSLLNGVRPWRQQREESPNQHRMDERRVSAHPITASQHLMTNSNKFRLYGLSDNGAGGAPIRQVPDQPQQRHGLNREV